MSGLSRPLPILLLLVAAGCGSSPREGDTLMLKGPAYVWRDEADMRRYRDYSRPDEERRALTWDSSRGALLHDGTSLQVLEIDGEAMRVRVAEDGANEGVRDLFGDHAGMIGYVPTDVEAVRMAR
jgi:hypothetical protein